MGKMSVSQLVKYGGSLDASPIQWSSNWQRSAGGATSTSHRRGHAGTRQELRFPIGHTFRFPFRFVDGKE